MSGSWASGWVDGDVVTAAEFRKGVGEVADQTLGSAAASIDFTGLPTSYAHLRILVECRGDTALANTAILLRFNGDTAANYDTEVLQASASSPTASESFAATSIVAGQMPAATAGASLAGTAAIDVINYSGTTFHKSVLMVGGYKIGTATGNVIAYRIQGFWRSTAAINRVTILPGAGNLVAGSRATIYVMGA